MKTKYTISSLFFAMLLTLTNCAVGPSSSTGAVPAGNVQTNLTKPKEGDITIKGKTFHYAAQCSGMDKLGNPENTPYDVYERAGDPTKLVISFAGGGACFDQSNCYGKYTQSYVDYDDLQKAAPATGVYNVSNPHLAQPLAGYSLVHIPYCTGDLHIGSKDTYYGPGSHEFPGSTYTGVTRHRGFDNVLYAIDYIRTRYKNLKQVFIIGTSAGSYGSIFYTPYLVEALGGYDTGTIRYSVIADSPGALFVKKENFLETVNQIWGVTRDVNSAGQGIFSALPDWVPGIIDEEFARGNLTQGAFLNRVARYYSKIPFGVVSSFLDHVMSDMVAQQRIIRDKKNYTYTDNQVTINGTKCAEAFSYGNGIGATRRCGGDAPFLKYYKNGGIDPVTGFWQDGLITELTQKVSANLLPNYSYFMYGGDNHVLLNNGYYVLQATNGVTLSSWFESLRDGVRPAPVMCDNNSPANAINKGCLCSLPPGTTFQSKPVDAGCAPTTSWADYE